MGRIVIKLVSPLYKHSFVLSSMTLRCLYIRHDFLHKIPRTVTRVLVSGCYGVASGAWRKGVIGYQNACTVLVCPIDTSLSGLG